MVAVGDATADAVVAGLKAQIETMKVGPGTDPKNDMGPLITRAHHEKVTGYIEQGLREGADLLVDGRDVKVPGHDNGFFMGPCLFDRVKPEMVIYREEIFGPVLGVVRVKTLDEAMQLIDAHEYGNGTCIFTRDGEAARYFRSGTGSCRDGRSQRAASRAGLLPLVRRLEALAVRRPARLRSRLGALLHQAQDDHAALALGRGTRGRGVLVPVHEMTRSSMLDPTVHAFATTISATTMPSRSRS